jgi:CheY-like chemotaxis protein
MSEGRKVLVVGGRSAACDQLAFALGRGGLTVARASSFEFPFAAAREQPDVALIDMADASLTMTRLTALLKEGQGGCRVVLFSDPSDTEKAKVAAKVLAVAHIPVSPPYDAVVRALEPFLARKEEQEETKSASGPHSFVALARASTRSEFAAAWTFPFLVSAPIRILPSMWSTTMNLLDDPPPSSSSNRPRNAPRKLSILAWPIRSTKPGPRDAIMVGRTSDNDVPIDHAHMSRHHAVFREIDGRLVLADVGSHNGTWVSGQQLKPNGAPSRPLSPGDVVRFGDLDLTFATPTGCWDMLRVNVR